LFLIYASFCVFRYGLFAAISTLLKADIGEYLEKMMYFMLLSLRSCEGVKASKGGRLLLG